MLNCFRVCFIAIILSGSALILGCGGGGSSSGTTVDNGATNGGTSGNGGNTGETGETAFLAGNVSYPDAVLSKPFINASGQKSFKVKVSDNNMAGKSGATIRAFYYDENGNKVETPVEAVTEEDDPATTEDESGNFKLTALDPALYANKLLSIEASFPSLTNTSMEVTVRQLIDMSSYELGVTTVECNPITEAILQQIIGLFAQYNIALTPAQLSAFATLINQITAAVESQLAEGGFEMDETNYYSGSIDEGGAGEELGFLAGTDAMISQYETTSLMNMMTDEQKTAKIIEFLCLMGFSVSAPGNKVYTMMDRTYFNCWFVSDLSLEQLGDSPGWGEIDIDPMLVPGFEDAVYAGASKTYKMAKGIFLVDPSLIFVDEMKWGYDADWDWEYIAGNDHIVDELWITSIDANGDGAFNDTVYFDSWKKQYLYETLTDTPPLSAEFVAEFQANLGASAAVAGIAAAVADNFQWMCYDTSNWMTDYTDIVLPGLPPLSKAYTAGISNDMNEYYIGTTRPLKNMAGQIMPVKDSEIISFFTSLNDTDTGKLPATPLDLANKIASGDDIVLALYQDCMNDVLQKAQEFNNLHFMDDGWEWFDPWIEINAKMITIDDIKEFVTDKTSFSSFTIGATEFDIIRRPIWETERDRIKNLIFTAIPSELLGTTLSDTTSVNMTTALVLTKMAINKKFRIDTGKDWIITKSSSWYDPVSGQNIVNSWVEVDWYNIKWLENKQAVDNPLKSLFTALVPDFAPAGDVWLDDALASQIETYGLMFSFDFPGDSIPETVPTDTSYDTWTDTDNNWINEVSVDITAQIVKSDLNNNVTALSGTAVTLYTVDWTLAGGDGRGEEIGTASTSDYGVFVFSGLSLYNDYIALFNYNGKVQEYWLYTDPWSNHVTIQDDPNLPNADIDLDGDGFYDTYTIHIGMSSGDPLPGTETAEIWQRSYPYWILTTSPGGADTANEIIPFYPEWAYLYDFKDNTYYNTDVIGCDLSIGIPWDPQFYISDIADTRINMLFTGYDASGTHVNQLSFPNGAAGYDVSEAYLGSTISDININRGVKWADYAEFKSYCTQLAEPATVSSPWDNYGNYTPAIFLIETNEFFNDSPIGYAYIIEVNEVYEWTWDETFFGDTTYTMTQIQSEVSFTYAMINVKTGEIKYPENFDVMANAKNATAIWPLTDGSVYNFNTETINVTLTTVPVLGIPGYAFESTNSNARTLYVNEDDSGNMRLLAVEKPGKIELYADYHTLENGLLLLPADAFQGWMYGSDYNVAVYDSTGTTLLNSFVTSYYASLWGYTDWSVYPALLQAGEYSGNAANIADCMSLETSMYSEALVNGNYTTLQNEFETFTLAPGWGMIETAGSDWVSVAYWEKFLLNATVPPDTLVLNDLSATVINADYKWIVENHNYFTYETDPYLGETWLSKYDQTYALEFTATAGISVTNVDVEFQVLDSNTYAYSTRIATLTKNIGTGLFEGTYVFPSAEWPNPYSEAVVNAYIGADVADTYSVYMNGYSYPVWVSQPYADWNLYEYALYSADPVFKFDFIYGTADTWILTVLDSDGNPVSTTGEVTNDTDNPYLYLDPYYYYESNHVPASSLTGTDMASDTKYSVVVEAWYGENSYTKAIVDFTYKP